MTNERTRRDEPKIVAGRPTPRVLEIRSQGYITRAEFLRVLEESEALLGEHPEVDAMLWNTLHHDGHDPGNTNLGMVFHRRHAERFQRAAILTHSAPMAALSNIARALLPELAIGVFGKREEAVAWLTRGHMQHGGRRTRAA
jgi:hypothetical protein